ncbi:MAG: hypothetical protein QOF00_2539 [Pseudonocardiales bacterium]|jgi:hypothetical protein|nr:hypothetical protein [Pseudonocardiales bacterium]
MLPEPGDTYGLSAGAASLSVTAYLLPLALFMPPPRRHPAVRTPHQPARTASTARA